MPTKLTDEMQKKVMDMLTGGTRDPDSPFIRDADGNTVQLFDQIIVKNLVTGVVIEYWWKGKHVSTQTVDHMLGKGDSVTVVGVTGQMGLKFTS